MKFILVIIASLFLCTVVNGQDYSKLKQADELYCNDDKSDLVLEALEECLKDSSYSRTDLGYVHYFMGDVYYNREEYEKAIIQFKASLEFGIYPIEDYERKCHLGSMPWRFIRNERAINIGRNFMNLGELDSAEFWFHQAKNKYKSGGCGLVMTRHYYRVDIEQIKLFLVKGDTISAQNRLIDRFFYYSEPEMLHKILLSKYTQEEIETELLKSIQNIKVHPSDSEYYIFTFFHHLVKQRLNRVTIEKQRKWINDDPSVRLLLNLPPMTRDWGNWDDED